MTERTAVIRRRRVVRDPKTGKARIITGGGNVQTFKGGKLVRERTREGKSVARILVQTGKSGSVVKSRPVKTQQDVRASQTIQKVQEQVNKASKALGEKSARVVGVVDPKNNQLKNIALRRDGRSFSLQEFNRELIRKRDLLKKRESSKEIAKETTPVLREQLKSLQEKEIVKKALERKGPTKLKVEFIKFEKANQQDVKKGFLDRKVTTNLNLSVDFAKSIPSKLLNIKKQDFVDLVNKSVNNAKKSYNFVRKNTPVAVSFVNKEIKNLVDKINKLDIKGIKDANRLIINFAKKAGKETAEFVIGKDEAKLAPALRNKSKATKEVILELTPFFNKQAQNSLRKPLKDWTTREAINFVGDFTLIAGIVKKLGKKAVSPLIKKFSKSNVVPTKPNRKLLNKLARLTNRQRIKTIDFGVSIIRDLGFANRVFAGTKQLYNVDNKVLSDAAKELGVSNSAQLLGVYNNFVRTELRDKNLDWRDYATFVGIVTGSENQIVRAQRNFKEFLRKNRFSDIDANKVISNLESFRRARALGQLFALTKIEISSDKLVNKLISQGQSKFRAISTGVKREGLSTLVVDSFIKETRFDPATLFLAVTLGVPYSIWASKTKGKVVKVGASQQKKAINKIVNTSTKKLSPARVNKYSDKVIAQSAKLGGEKLTPVQIKQIRAQFTLAEKKKMARAYIKSAIILTRQRKKPLPKKFKEKVLLRDPFVNFFDPFEFLGDKVQDLTALIAKKIGRGVKKSKKKVPKKKISSIAKSKTRVSTKTKAVTKTKVKPKPRPKTKARSKPKVKPKPRPKPKPKPKAKPRPKTKPRPKPKPKAKPRPKPKPKVKTKNIGLPKLKKSLKKGERVAYDLRVKVKNKLRTIRVNLPVNRAKEKIIKLVNAKKISSGKVFAVGITKKKDITSLSLARTRKKLKN